MTRLEHERKCATNKTQCQEHRALTLGNDSIIPMNENMSHIRDFLVTYDRQTHYLKECLSSVVFYPYADPSNPTPINYKTYQGQSHYFAHSRCFYCWKEGCITGNGTNQLI